MASDLLQAVAEVARRADAVASAAGRRLRIMEVCGTHTSAITRSGLRELLAAVIQFRSGPGCPVCVTSAEDLALAAGLARHPATLIATPGDLMRVPTWVYGERHSLEELRAAGLADVRVITSPLQALSLAAANPPREVVLIGIGFETTSPLVAATVLRAATGEAPGNLSVLSLHKRMPPALWQMLAANDLGVDGLLLPGHVSVVTGRRAFDFVSSDRRVPAVIAGFEPMDVLLALSSLLRQIDSAKPAVANLYPRAVTEQGNMVAQELVDRVFAPADADWRGLGCIPESGLELRPEYRRWDAIDKLDLDRRAGGKLPSPPGCRCGDVLAGRIDPPDCPEFALSCAPLRPHGPCMVSAEGACQIAYRAAAGNGG